LKVTLGFDDIHCFSVASMLVRSFSAVSKVTGSEICQWFIVAQGSAMHKACLCGSKRKYKSGCGTQCPKLSITSVQRMDEVPSHRLRKQRLKLAKDHGNEPVHSNVPRAVDMGALCI
jgi:hypothetical protein